ncbi:MAG: M36 family metallopeptidase [Acidobacteria bacterium]|nr:M36 family metallopeptidase [Acidobacteriota bacterium]
MQNSSKGTGARWGLLLSFVVLALVAAVAVVPTQFDWEASGQGKGLQERTASHVEGLENYDIRENQKSPEVEEALLKYRDTAGKTASFVADVREGFVRGEESLKTRVPSLEIEYNTDIRIPEVIGPDVKQGVNFLTGPATGSRVDMLRNFAKQNSELIGVNDEQVNQLKVLADYTNPDGGLSFVHLEQQIDGVPVFRGEIKAGFTKNNEIVRVINNLAPGVEYNSVSKNFGDPLQAVNHAARHINVDVSTLDLTVNESASDSNRTVFGRGDWATTAERMYFPTEPGIVVPAHRVLIWQPVNAFYVIVDANTGTMLWRKNITEDQTQAATYQVYRNSNAMIDVADSPAPLSPGPIDPGLGTQAPVGTRVNISRIGNEAPYTFVNNGWITDGTNLTDGNFNEAGVDRVAPNGVDAPQPGDGACPGAGCREFTSTWNPAPGNPAPGDDPLTAQAQRGAVIQMFYAMNWYQSEMYRLGFTEQAFNFQQDNFGRGGVGADRVSSEGQDSSGTNNANFSTPADGGRGRMQMYVWTGPTPDYDGTADADVIIHEVTHGLSNRLHGNASGLSTNMARGMGEGWSDFYAHSMLSEPTDPANGIYSLGGYATYLVAAGFAGNYYYGIRRYPKAPLQFTGGVNNKPHNAYRFSDINAGCATRFTNADFAFGRGPIGSATCDQVHNIGEIWSSILWEVRHRMITRLGWAEGNRKTLQWVTDGMKLAPIGPTLLTERDAILAAVQASGTGADVADFWAGFAARGLGFDATIISASPANVTDGFNLPNAFITDPFSVSDSTGDNDGFPEPGENVQLSVAVTNTTGQTVTNVSVAVTGGATVNFGTINNGQTVTQNIPYTVPGDAVCGAMHQVEMTVTTSVGVNSPTTREFRLGAPVGGAPVTFANSTAINMPNGQPTTTSGPAGPYPSTIDVTGVSGTKLIKVTFNNFRHEFLDDVDMLLVGPGGQKFIFVSDAGGSTEQLTPITFSVADNGPTQLPDAAAFVNGTTYRPANYGANDPFDAPAPAAPYENAAPGGAATFASVFGTDGSAMNGTWSLVPEPFDGRLPGTQLGYLDRRTRTGGLRW